jgi:AcrR family transcriptional regulator
MAAVTVALSRELVLDAARARLERGGAGDLSLRGVARDLGVTAPALYAYVDHKQDLLAAVATEHFDRLLARFEAVEADDTLDRIRALGRAYVDHALESPALFRLMFRYLPARTAGAAAFPPAARAFEAAAATMAAAAEAGALTVDDVPLASMTMWAAVHGVAEVLLMGFDFDAGGADALITSVIETVLAGQTRALAR